MKHTNKGFRGIGWHNESKRHSLARQGIKTGGKITDKHKMISIQAKTDTEALDNAIEDVLDNQAKLSIRNDFGFGVYVDIDPDISYVIGGGISDPLDNQVRKILNLSSDTKVTEDHITKYARIKEKEIIAKGKEALKQFKHISVYDGDDEGRVFVIGANTLQLASKIKRLIVDDF